jgi:hypothetical protein
MRLVNLAGLTRQFMRTVLAELHRSISTHSLSLAEPAYIDIGQLQN